MILMKIKPSIYLSTIVWVWGCVVIGMSQSKGPQALIAGRFFLGAIEAGLFPGALFVLTCWYTKREVGKLRLPLPFRLRTFLNADHYSIQ